MRTRFALHAYLTAVTVLGLPAAVWAVARVPEAQPTVSWWVIGCLMVALVASELKTVELAQDGRNNGTVAISGAFVLALVFLAPIGVAVAAMTVATLVDGVGRRGSLRLMAFNIAQYTAAILAARLVFCASTGSALLEPGPMPAHFLPGMVVASAVYLLVNALLVSAAHALKRRASLMSTLCDDIRMHWATYALELSLVPFTVLAADYSILLLPVLLLPVAFAVRATRLAVERERAAVIDALTGLPNPAQLRTLYLRRREEHRAGEDKLAVLFVRIDGLEEVAEALGESASDELLVSTAARLSANVREGDVVAHRSDSTFAILAPLHDPDAEADLHCLATRLQECLGEPFELAGVSVHIQASIGVAVTDDTDDAPALLFSQAGAALRVARKTTKGALHRYTAADEVSTPERLALVGELKEAIANGGLEVHYQPKVEAHSGAVTGVEALVRWRRGSQLVFPDTFIPLAERTGLIEGLTWNVLEQALDQTAQWYQRGWNLGVAVNFAAEQLVDPATPGKVLGLLAKTGLPAHLLTVEVTEGTIMSDEDKAGQILRQLRHVGVRASLDDYGTGYSSMTYLQKLDVDELKIDKSFVMKLADPDNTGDAAIVKATITLAHDLGLRVVAEGVENQACSDVLRRFGCDVLQGYHYTKPLPGADIDAWLSARSTMGAPPRQRHTDHVDVPETSAGA